MNSSLAISLFAVLIAIVAVAIALFRKPRIMLIVPQPARPRFHAHQTAPLGFLPAGKAGIPHGN